MDDRTGQDQRLGEALERATLWLRCEAAAVRVIVAFEHFRDAVFERRNNPDWASEPRVPAGDPAGGQWTGGGGVLVAASGGYPVNLLDEEARGAHVVSEHVGASEDYLRMRLAQSQADAQAQGDTATGLSVGSFTSLAAATRLVNSTLAKNAAEVAAVASGAVGGAQLDADFPVQLVTKSMGQRSAPNLLSEPHSAFAS